LFLLRPRWLALHAFVVGAGVGMVFLGRWQWHVAGQRHGDIRNYAYALQWWLFVAFAVAFWARVVRDARRPRDGSGSTSISGVFPGRGPGGAGGPRPEPVGAGPADGFVPSGFQPYAMPQADAIHVDDPALAAYNVYLSAIAQPAHILAGDNRPVGSRTDPQPITRAAVPDRTGTPVGAAGDRADPGRTSAHRRSGDTTSTGGDR